MVAEEAERNPGWRSALAKSVDRYYVRLECDQMHSIHSTAVPSQMSLYHKVWVEVVAGCPLYHHMLGPGCAGSGVPVAVERVRCLDDCDKTMMKSNYHSGYVEHARVCNHLEMARMVASATMNHIGRRSHDAGMLIVRIPRARPRPLAELPHEPA
jgi:hypothetical protein